MTTKVKHLPNKTAWLWVESQSGLPPHPNPLPPGEREQPFPITLNAQGLLTCLLCLALSLLALAQPAQAHLTKYTGAEHSSTVAEIWIADQRVTLRLEIGDLDREAFGALLDDEPAAQDEAPLGLVLTGEAGAPLAGRVTAKERRPRTDRSTASPSPPAQIPGGAEVTYVEVVYDLASRPATLTLTPPRRIGSTEAAAEIGFIVYHETIPVIDFQYLERPETLRLDWRDPWYSAFENAALKRHHSAPVMTFLYVEPYEVRLEILIRLKALAAWMALDVPEQAPIDADTQAGLRERIGQFFVRTATCGLTAPRPAPCWTAWSSSG